MKPLEFKKMIKDAVREAIQEELKEILLEAVKAPRGVVVENKGYSTVNESKDTYGQPYIEQPKQLTASERRNMFAGMIGEMQNGGIATSQYAGDFVPKSVDAINGALPEGNVGLDQIMALMKK